MNPDFEQLKIQISKINVQCWKKKKKKKNVCVQRWMLSVLLGSTIHDVVGPNYIYRIFPQVDSVFSYFLTGEHTVLPMGSDF